ncbi:MAG: hypothetical protein HYX57_03425 [Chloroflexi bacterium]|nr:hypothetical protein [Chloroflexota bacterium]
MTNTKQIKTDTQLISFDDRARAGRTGSDRNPMQGMTEQNQVVIRRLIRERELEAANARLAASARATPSGLRRTVGRLLIQAGRRVAGEPGSSGSPVARPARPMAA